MRQLSSEWLRTKRTAVRWLIFFMPMVIAICTLAYLTLRSDSTQAFVFEGFFTIWSGIINPLIVGVLTGFVVHEEELAGNFTGFLGIGISRTRLFLGKFLLLLSCMVICIFIAILILSSGMKLFIPCGADMKLFMLAALLTSVGTLPLLALHLWVSFAWGMGASIGISIGGLIMAILFGTTSLGADIWQFIPWTWPVKLGLLPGTVFVEKTQNTITNAVNTGTTAFIATAIALSVLLPGGILWFSKWEGYRMSE